jgi:hypothetical protein
MSEYEWFSIMTTTTCPAIGAVVEPGDEVVDDGAGGGVLPGAAVVAVGLVESELVEGEGEPDVPPEQALNASSVAPIATAAHCRIIVLNLLDGTGPAFPRRAERNLYELLPGLFLRRL